MEQQIIKKENSIRKISDRKNKIRDPDENSPKKRNRWTYTKKGGKAYTSG